MFDKINHPQWLWYYSQCNVDDKEQFEMLRDIAEHNASFWNPEGVDQIRRAREKTFIVSDKNFAKQLEENFGRKLNIPDKREDFTLPTRGQEKRQRQKMRKDINAEAYLNTELDEIRFIPLRK